MIQLLVGAVLGAGTALLFAPSTGRGTRAKLKEQGKKLQYGMERFGEFVEKKKQHFSNKLLGFQHDMECAKDKAQEKAAELKTVATEKSAELKVKAGDLKHVAVENAEVLKKDLGELKKDFDDAIQDFRAPSDEIKSDKSQDFPPKPPTTRTTGGTF